MAGKWEGGPKRGVPRLLRMLHRGAQSREQGPEEGRQAKTKRDTAKKRHREK